MTTGAPGAHALTPTPERPPSPQVPPKAGFGFLHFILQKLSCPSSGNFDTISCGFLLISSVRRCWGSSQPRQDSRSIFRQAEGQKPRGWRWGGGTGQGNEKPQADTLQTEETPFALFRPQESKLPWRAARFFPIMEMRRGPGAGCPINRGGQRACPVFSCGSHTGSAGGRESLPTTAFTLFNLTTPCGVYGRS